MNKGVMHTQAELFYYGYVRFTERALLDTTDPSNSRLAVVETVPAGIEARAFATEQSS